MSGTILEQLKTWRGYLESQIDNQQTALIHKKYRYKRMMRDKEDDDIWSLEDDEYSLEFIFDRSIKMEEFS